MELNGCGMAGVSGGGLAGGHSMTALGGCGALGVDCGSGVRVAGTGAVSGAWAAVVQSTAGVLGIWSNRTHPVGPDPSHSSTRSLSGQQSQSIAWSRNSGVMLYKLQ
jgi:hypothetical protein